MRELKVVHIINSLETGGAEALLVGLTSVASLDEHHIVALSPPGWHTGALVKRGIDVRHIGTHSFCSAVSTLVRLLRELKPEVVQTWLYRSNVIGGLAGNVAGVPVIWGVHCSTFDSRFPLKSRSLIYASGVIAPLSPTRIVHCSEKAAAAHEAIGYPKSRTTIVRNGYDTSAFAPDSEARSGIRRELGIGEDMFLIGTVARLHPQKDHRNLIEALRQSPDLGEHWRCLFVGPGVGLDNSVLRQMVASAGLSKRVILSEARADIQRVMSALDLHVLPSAFGEAFPNVTAEAMACETPCIVTDVGDAAFVVGDTGWVVPPSQSESLARAIREAMKEAAQADGRWLARRRAARRRIVENFTSDKMYAGYRKVWTACVAPGD